MSVTQGSQSDPRTEPQGQRRGSTNVPRIPLLLTGSSIFICSQSFLDMHFIALKWVFLTTKAMEVFQRSQHCRNPEPPTPTPAPGASEPALTPGPRRQRGSRPRVTVVRPEATSRSASSSVPGRVGSSQHQQKTKEKLHLCVCF